MIQKMYNPTSKPVRFSIPVTPTTVDEYVAEPGECVDVPAGYCCGEASVIKRLAPMLVKYDTSKVYVASSAPPSNEGGAMLPKTESVLSEPPVKKKRRKKRTSY